MSSDYKICLGPYSEKGKHIRSKKYILAQERIKRFKRAGKSKHLEKFHTLIEYVLKLRRDGDIDEELLAKLVREIASNFIEQEVTERVENALEEKISIERFMELLLK